MKLKRMLGFTTTAATAVLLLSGFSANNGNEEQERLIPADKFDLSTWKMTVPTDSNNNGKVDQVSVEEMQTFEHPDYFYLDDDGNMVFASPNKAFTTPNSSNTRSELHQVLGSADLKSIDHGNNFTIASTPNAEEFAQIGGNLQATLKVNHVAKRATHADKFPAYSVVIGQIHATKDQAKIDAGEGLGYGNEPLKIYYKKWPDHEYGSVFWNYERNLAVDDPDRIDIAYPVWGNTWENPNEPGIEGIKLDEEFSYEVEVYQDTMYLTFTTERHDTVTYEINLADNVDAYGDEDTFDLPTGYAGEANFFKAGGYNQCSTKDDPGFWYAGCLGTGDWETDKANGDYIQVTFSRLETGPSRFATEE